MTGANAYAVLVPVLGLPLGGKVEQKIRICPPDPGKSKEVCWIGKPSVIGGDRLGSAHLPNPDLRPGWAAHAMFDIHVGKDGELKQLTVRAFDTDETRVISNSISSRFGLPTRQTTLQRDGVRSATWARSDIFINLLCSEQWCSVDFRSSGAQAELERQIVQGKRKQAARPVSP